MWLRYPRSEFRTLEQNLCSETRKRVFFVIKLICGWSCCPSTLHLSLRVIGADHVPRYGSRFGSFAKSTLKSPNASQIDILVAIGRSSVLSLARSDFNIQRIMVRICERSPLNVVRICELLSASIQPPFAVAEISGLVEAGISQPSTLPFSSL